MHEYRPRALGMTSPLPHCHPIRVLEVSDTAGVHESVDTKGRTAAMPMRRATVWA